MALITCNSKCSCTVAALIVSAIIGVLTAFFQITGMITLSPVFLWVAFGIAVVYLGILVVASGSMDREERLGCRCSVLNTLLAAILGTILLSLVLLAVGIVATSVVSAILVGLLLFFQSLTFAGSACFVRWRSDCGG